MQVNDSHWISSLGFSAHLRLCACYVDAWPSRRAGKFDPITRARSWLWSDLHVSAPIRNVTWTCNGPRNDTFGCSKNRFTDRVGKKTFKTVWSDVVFLAWSLDQLQRNCRTKGGDGEQASVRGCCQVVEEGSKKDKAVREECNRAAKKNGSEAICGFLPDVSVCWSTGRVERLQHLWLLAVC